MTRGSWDPGLLRPGTLRPMAGTLGSATLWLWDSETRTLTPRTLELGPWDMRSWHPETCYSTPRILRTGPWELNLWNRFAVSQPTPQIILTLIMKHNFDNKKLWYLSRKLRGSSIWTKHLPKYSEIWHNTKKLENI